MSTDHDKDATKHFADGLDDLKGYLNAEIEMSDRSATSYAREIDAETNSSQSLSPTLNSASNQKAAIAENVKTPKHEEAGASIKLAAPVA